MYVAYLCGGIASGKSYAAGLLEKMGAYRIDLDQLSRDILHNEVVLKSLAVAFGKEVIRANQSLDRKLLAERAFVSRETQDLLESCTLPAIKNLFIERLNEIQKSNNSAFVVVEVPLLDKFIDMKSYADELVFIEATLNVRENFALTQRGLSIQSFNSRVALQKPPSYIKSFCDTVLINDGSDQFKHVVKTWFYART